VTHFKSAGTAIGVAAGVLVAGIALVEFNRGEVLRIFGWLLVVCAVVAMLGAVFWVVLSLTLPRLARLLVGGISERLDLDDLAARIAARVQVPVPEPPSPLFPQQVAASVVQDLRQQNLLKTAELSEEQQQRRLVAHSVIRTLEEHIFALTVDFGKLQPFNRGESEPKRGLLHCSPTYDDAVRATERAFQHIGRLQPHTATQFPDRGADAADHAQDAVQQLQVAMRNDSAPPF